MIACAILPVSKISIDKICCKLVRQEIYNSFPPSVLDPLVQGVPEKLELGKEAVKQVNIIVLINILIIIIIIHPI